MYKEGLYLYHTWKTSNISNIFIKINLYLKKERENRGLKWPEKIVG